MNRTLQRLADAPLGTGLGRSVCSYWQNGGACAKPSAYVVHLNECGCTLLRGLNACKGHGACAEHAAVGRSESRVITIGTLA